MYSKFMLCLVDLRVSCCAKCFLHGAFCLGARKLDPEHFFCNILSVSYVA